MEVVRFKEADVIVASSVATGANNETKNDFKFVVGNYTYENNESAERDLFYKDLSEMFGYNITGNTLLDREGTTIVNDIEIATLRTSQKHKSDFYSFSKCNF